MRNINYLLFFLSILCCSGTIKTKKESFDKWDRMTMLSLDDLILEDSEQMKLYKSFYIGDSSSRRLNFLNPSYRFDNVYHKGADVFNEDGYELVVVESVHNWSECFDPSTRIFIKTNEGEILSGVFFCTSEKWIPVKYETFDWSTFSSNLNSFVENSEPFNNEHSLVTEDSDVLITIFINNSIKCIPLVLDDGEWKQLSKIWKKFESK